MIHPTSDPRTAAPTEPLDQATHLRRLVEKHPGFAPAPPPPAPTNDPRPLATTIAIASGKGGVGKTSISVNLAASLAKLRIRTTLLDGDLGLGNADVLCGVNASIHLGHVLDGQRSVEEVAVGVAPRFNLIPGASGVTALADLPPADLQRLYQRLAPLDEQSDALIVDCGAGIGSSVLSFCRAADLVLIVTTPEPTSITDAYALTKCLARAAGDHPNGPAPDIALIVNQATCLDEAVFVHRRLDQVSQRFLGRALPLIGVVPRDPAVSKAVIKRRPLLYESPTSRAARGIELIASRLKARLELESPDVPRTGLIARLLHFTRN